VFGDGNEEDDHDDDDHDDDDHDDDDDDDGDDGDDGNEDHYGVTIAIQSCEETNINACCRHDRFSQSERRSKEKEVITCMLRSLIFRKNDGCSASGWNYIASNAIARESKCA